MKFNKFFIGFTALIMSSSLILLAGCNEPSLISKWRDREILIDGFDREWGECHLYTDQKTGTTIGVYNDEEYAYICLASSDEDIQQQFISQGLIVWLNQTGGKDEQLGINYPTGVRLSRRDQGPTDADREERGTMPPQQPGGMEGGSQDSSGQAGGTPTLSLTDVEIMDENENRKSIQMDELVNYSMGARFNIEDGRLVYELIIPLKQTMQTPYAALASNTRLIGLGFETGNFSTPRTRSKSVRGISGMGGQSSDMSSGGMGGGGGGMGGGGGGMGGGGGGMSGGGGGMSGGGGGMSGGGDMSGGGMSGMSTGQSQSLKLWTKIELAPKPVTLPQAGE